MPKRANFFQFSSPHYTLISVSFWLISLHFGQFWSKSKKQARTENTVLLL